MATVEVVFSSSRDFSSPSVPPKPTAAGLFGSPNFVFLFGGGGSAATPFMSARGTPPPMRLFVRTRLCAGKALFLLG